MFSSGIEVDIEQEQNLKFISCNDFMKVFGRILGFWDGITMKLEGPNEEQTRFLMKSFVPLKLKKDNFRLFDASSSASFSSRRMPSLSSSRSQLHISLFFFIKEELLYLLSQLARGGEIHQAPELGSVF